MKNWFFLCIMSFAFASPALAVIVQDQGKVLSAQSDRAIRETILFLGIGEKERDGAINRLRAFPRKNVLAVLRDDMAAEGPKLSDANLRAMSELSAIELLPELRFVAQKTESWLAFVTINHLLVLVPEIERAKFAVIYQARLKGYLPPVARIAAIDGLTQDRVPVESFAKLLADANFEVRIAAAENLALAGANLSPGERLDRISLAFNAKPYQVRVIALRAAAKLVSSEKSKLRSRMPSSVCASGARREVRVACADVGGDVK